MDEYWRNSAWCTFAGIMSTISSEASVIFLCLITLDRLIVIRYPFSQMKFTPKNAGIASSFAWFISVAISIMPIVATEHFQNKFYTKSGVCIALPLTRDRPPGWLYSIIIFIGVNFVTFIGIAIGQLSIYLEIKHVSSKIKFRGGKSKTNRRKELTVARNLLLVVATDFLCWFPIGCMGMMAMSGYVIPGEVYAWVAVFILPINSAINPVLYTLTAMLGKRKQQDIKVDSNVNSRTRQSTLRNKTGLAKMVAYFIPRKEKFGVSWMTIDDIIQLRMEIVPEALLKLTTQLAEVLHLLHRNSMVLEVLEPTDVVVALEHGKITGNIQINQHPKNGTSLENRKENMYKLGLIVRRLMSSYSKQV